MKQSKFVRQGNKTPARGVGCAALAAGLLALALASCASSDHRAAALETSSSDNSAALLSPEDNLRHRAQLLWSARQREDWPTVFQFADADVRRQATAEQFAEWAAANESFQVRDFTLQRVLVDGDMGWVELDLQLGLRKFPNIPTRAVQRWEKWHVHESQWFPVPIPEWEHYPQSPALRDALEEQRLLQRFEQAWQAKLAGDTLRLAQFTTAPSSVAQPCDTASESETSAQLDALVQYVGREVQWVEVIGSRGTVRVAYNVELKDPSLAKLPPKNLVVNERWIKLDGEWYFQPAGAG